MSFVLKEINGFSFWQSSTLVEDGLVHGFVGRPYDFSAPAFDMNRRIFLEAFSAKKLFLPKQIHSERVIDLRDEESLSRLINGTCEHGFDEGDAIIVSRKESDGVAFGIRTADCLPIMCVTNTEIALIHAGWRGLANGVIGKTLASLSNHENLRVLIGPAACFSCYEVGEEVVDAIGKSAVAEIHGEGKFLLDTVNTAKMQIHLSSQDQETIEVLPLCTIEKNFLHSYRREGAPVGSNLCFVIL